MAVEQNKLIGNVADNTARQRTRNTQQRKAVLSAVQNLDGKHPTAADVFALLRVEHPHMSLATVYRALHALVEQNALTEMRVENVARYDAGPEAHHHLVCRRCGTVADIDPARLSSAVLRRLGRQVEQASNFVLDAHPIQFSGLCGECRG